MGTQFSTNTENGKVQNDNKENFCEGEDQGSNLQYNLIEDIIKKLEFILTSNNPDYFEEIEKLKKGKLIKIAFVGRYGNNYKFKQIFFPNENAFDSFHTFTPVQDKSEKIFENCEKSLQNLKNVKSVRNVDKFFNEKNSENSEKYFSDSEPDHYYKNKILENNSKNKNTQNSQDLKNSQISTNSLSFPFFSNLNNLEFLSTYFSSFHSVETFKKNFIFKTDFFSEDYENCIQLDLPEMALLIEQLCLNDIVIYCTDKTNQNIFKEANFFKYLYKRSALFRNCVINGQFYIILNNHIHDSSMFHYQNEEANQIFKSLNTTIGHKFIFDIDIEKSFEEKIVYFALLFENKGRRKSLECRSCSEKIFRRNSKIEKNEKIQISQKIEKNNSSIYFDNYFTSDVTKLLNFSFSKNISIYSNKNKFDTLKSNFREVVKKKFKILNSKNFDINSIEKKFPSFYQNFLKTENYFSYELNKIKEFDKELYDSFIRKLNTKFSNLKYEILLDTFLQKNQKNINNQSNQNNENNLIPIPDENFNKIFSPPINELSLLQIGFSGLN
jgi:hypothetical protein